MQISRKWKVVRFCEHFIYKYIHLLIGHKNQIINVKYNQFYLTSLKIYIRTNNLKLLFLRVSKIKFMKHLILTLILFAFSPDLPAQKLPAKIKSHLDSTFPGWAFSTNAAYCVPGGTGKSKYLITGDFDNNRKPDYVVKIKTKSKGYIIAYLQKGEKYTPYITYNESSDSVEDCRLELIKQKINISQCEVSSYYLVYKNGRFTEHYISD